MPNLNVIAMLQSVSRELAQQLNAAGVSSKKSAEIVEAIEGKLSPAITEIEELRDVLHNQFFSPADGDTTGGQSRVGKTELLQKVKKFIGEPGLNEYVDENGVIRKYIFT